MKSSRRGSWGPWLAWWWRGRSLEVRSLKKAVEAESACNSTEGGVPDTPGPVEV